MRLEMELQGTPERRYWERRDQIVTSPAELLQSFKDQWLRVVGEIEQCPYSYSREVLNRDGETIGIAGYYQCSWLITTRQTDERDDYNLKLANDQSLQVVTFEPGYLVLDPELADQILCDGIKYHGVPFLYDFDPDLVDRILREITPWKQSYAADTDSLEQLEVTTCN